MKENKEDTPHSKLICLISHENRDFAIAKSQFSPNPMLKKGLTHYKE